MRFALVSGNVMVPGSGRSIVIPIAKALKELNHEVYLVDVSSTTSKKLIDSDTGLPVFRVGPWSSVVRHPLLSMNYLSGRNILPWMTAYELGRIINTLAVDVIYVLSNFNVLPILMRAPFKDTVLIINLIGFGIAPNRGGKDNTFWIQSEIFSRPLWDIHACATDVEYQAYSKVYNDLLVDSKKLRLIPHSYDSSAFFTSNEKVKTDRKLIVYPVAVYPRKNVEFLLAVSAKLLRTMPVDIVITGPIVDASYYNFLTKLASDLEIVDSVSFLKGQLTSEQLGELFRRTDLVVFPSFQETFGIGIIESLACGVPILLPNDIPALKPFFTLKGVQSADRNIDSFFTMAVNILQSPANERRAIATEVRQRFSNTAVAQQIISASYDAFHVHNKRANLQWEKLYQDKEFSHSIFRGKAKS